MNLSLFKTWLNGSSQTAAPTVVAAGVQTTNTNTKTEASQFELGMTLLFMCGAAGVILGIGIKVV